MLCDFCSTSAWFLLSALISELERSGGNVVVLEKMGGNQMQSAILYNTGTVMRFFPQRTRKGNLSLGRIFLACDSTTEVCDVLGDLCDEDELHETNSFHAFTVCERGRKVGSPTVPSGIFLYMQRKIWNRAPEGHILAISSRFGAWK